MQKVPIAQAKNVLIEAAERPQFMAALLEKHTSQAHGIRLARNLPREEFRFSQSLTSTPIKITLLSPDRLCEEFDRQNVAGVYTDVEEFLADVIAVERRIVGELVEDGGGHRDTPI